MSTQNFKFDNFNENNTNRFSVVVCKQIFQLPNDLKTVWLYGPIGSGKTHLLCATKNHFNQKYSVVFLTAKELTNKLLDYNHQSQLKKIDEADLLIIDDADYLVSKTTAQEEIAKLIFKKESKGQRSLFASNCEPKELSILFKHFFNDALFADVGFTVKERHKEITLNFLKVTKIEIDEDALELLIETELSEPQFSRTLRAIERCYNKKKKKITYQNMKDSINSILRFYDEPTI